MAFAHTHPSQHQWSQYPSGYSSPAAYQDVDLNPANGNQISDLKIANDFYDDHPQPIYRNLNWYLAGRTQQGVTIFSRYKKTAQLWAEDNIYRFDLANDVWVKVLNAPW